MKKIILGLLILTSLFTLNACKEITDDYNNQQLPAIELKNIGQLVQIYDENTTLEDVTFTVTLKRFEENEIDMETVTINWYVREVLIESYTNLTEITQVVNAPGEISVRVVVTYTFEEELKTLEQSKLISVAKIPTQILITNDANENTHKIAVKLGNESDIKFSGRITGNLNHPIIRWVIQKQTTSEPVIYDDIAAEIIKVGNEATSSLQYQFIEVGNYIVTLQTGEGQSQDANRYISNSIHINVNYGVYELTSPSELVLSEDAEDFERYLVVSELDQETVGAGSYEWYLNGELLEHTGITYTHTSSEPGGYLYQVKFRKTSTNEILDVTNPILVINGVEVANEEELLTALENEVKGIILTDDIVYTNPSDALNLNYPVTIYGNGHELSSLEILVFMSITSSHVNLSNLKITRANRYNLMISNVENIYLEHLAFEELGGGTNQDDFLNGEFGSAIYINKSEVVVNNVEFLTGGLVGIRIDNDHSTQSKLARLELIGEFKYSNEDPLLLPIGSGKSHKDGIEVVANGFDYFALPAGNITIRRWDNQGQPITWEIYNPQKIEYINGEFIDLFGIGINIDLSFLKIEFSNSDGLMFVKLYIDQFGQYGKIEVTPIDSDTVLNRFYVIGEYEDTVYGNDKLVYSLTPELNIENGVRPTLDLEPGQYRLRIYIGEEFYLGHIIITVNEAQE